jgi:hypothetical protein
MRAPLDTLEAELVRDLDGLSGRLRDESFCAELYRGLTDRTLTKAEDDRGHLLLSWTRASEFVNELRARESLDPLPLARSGGEGVISETVLDELTARGWQTRALNT